MAFFFPRRAGLPLSGLLLLGLLACDEEASSSTPSAAGASGSGGRLPIPPNPGGFTQNLPGSGGGGAGGSGSQQATLPAATRFLDLTVLGEGFEEHASKPFALAVVHKDSGEVVASVRLPSLEGGAFSFAWPGLLREDQEYAVDYFVELHDDQVCASPPPGNPEGDLVWRKGIFPSFADTFKKIPLDSKWSDHCSSFNDKPPRRGLSLQFNKLEKQAGQRAMVAVAREDSGQVVARKTILQIPPEGTLKLDWPGLLDPEASYRVDWMVDANKDGACDSTEAAAVSRARVDGGQEAAQVSISPGTAEVGDCEGFSP